MATLISKASGNFTSNTTWGLVDATSFLDSQAANAALTTSYVGATTFIPGAITIDALAVKVALRVGTTGTMSVQLSGAGAGAVAGSEVTINVSDLQAGDTAANNGVGWTVFKFPTPITLSAGIPYAVQAKTSSSTQVNLYSSATNNWSRALRTTTTQSPSSSDVIIVAGEWTSAGNSTSYTVTLDNTSALTYGTTTINNKSTLSLQTSALSSYTYNIAGIMRVYGGGTLNFGTTNIPLPSTSSFTLSCKCVAAVDYGLELQNGATFNAHGSPLSYVTAKLAADAAASATTCTTSVSTGWKSGNVIVFPSTTRTATQRETKALTADAIGTSLSTVALTNAHGGNASTGVQADIGNLTRNVKIVGVSTSVTGYILIRNGATVDMDYVEMSFLGSNTANKRAVDIQTAAAGITNIQYCSLANSNITSAQGFYISGATSNNITLFKNIVYSVLGAGIVVANATTGTYTISQNLVVGSGGIGMNIADVGGILTDNIVASSVETNIEYNEAATITGVVSGNVTYSGNLHGQQYGSALLGGTISNITSWRNNGVGVVLTTSRVNPIGTTLSGVNTFGNNTAGIYCGASAFYGLLTIKSATTNAGTTLTEPYGLFFNGNIDYAVIQDSSFGFTQAHTGDIRIASSNLIRATLHNCKFSSAGTPISNYVNQLENVNNQWGLASMNHQQVQGDNRLYTRYGIIRTDTTIFKSQSPSQRITPNSATWPLNSASKFVAVTSGNSVTIKVYVRTSSTSFGDSDNYNGSLPVLLLRSNPSIGIVNDTTLYTMTPNLSGTWEQFVGTTQAVTGDGVLEFLINCNGTLGWVNVDDWSTTTNNDPRGNKFWSNGQVYSGAEYNAGGNFGFS